MKLLELESLPFPPMTENVMDLLVCPACHAKPQLHSWPDARAHSEKRTPSEKMPNGVPRGETAGVLKCSCGKVYPIVEGVPRFLADALQSFPEFVRAHREQLLRICSARDCEPSRGVGSENDYDNIRKSFSQEWGIFDYESDKTWGWTLEERKKVFLGDVELSEEELRGKKMLDAGCGNGTLTAALSDFGMQIVGLDLNDGLGRAFSNRGNYGRNAQKLVHYVQGNLVEPPLQEDTFDLIYSSGVIHHTPSSKRTFHSLARLVKRGGRLYVWVYSKRGWPVRLFFWLGRVSKSFLSLKSLMTICRLLSPVYKAAAVVLNALGIMKFRSRSTQEITLDLFDAFAPRYNHYHSPEEVQSWFKELGFKNIAVSGLQKHGFGVHGDKP